MEDNDVNYKREKIYSEIERSTSLAIKFIWELHGSYTVGTNGEYHCKEENINKLIKLFVENTWYDMSFAFKYDQYPFSFKFPQYEEEGCDLESINKFLGSYFTRLILVR